MKYLNRLSIVILVIAAAIGVFLWQRHTGGPVTKKSLTTVTLALDWTPNTDHTGVYTALAKGWYKEQGIDLKILPYSSTVYVSTLLDSKKADIGIMTTEDVVAEAAAGRPLVEIGSLLQHNPSGLIVRQDSGITSPRGLDGKIYGGFGSPVADAIVKSAIKYDGGQGQFQNVVLNIEAMQALESKKIDFVWGFEGWELMEAKKDGIKTNFFPITSYGVPDAPTLAFSVTPDKLKKDGDLLKRFITATARGYEDAVKNPHADAQLLINDAPKGTFPDTALVFDSQTFVSTQYTNKAGQWGIQDPKAWANYAQFILDTGTVSDSANKPVKSLNFAPLYTNQYVTSAR